VGPEAAVRVNRQPSQPARTFDVHLKLDLIRNRVESHQQHEEHEARIRCILRRGQRHHATTHGDHTHSSEGGSSV